MTSLPGLFIQKMVYPDPNLQIYLFLVINIVLYLKKKTYKIFVTVQQFVLLCIGGGHLKITDTMICAGIEGKPQSGCFGDSGGPYVCQSSSGKWFLQGAVSWGSLSCDASDRYSVFARVAQFRDWIRQHTGV